MKNLAKKGMALGLIAAMLCATTVTAATNRAGSIVSTGSVTMNTDIGSATIDADDIYENAVAIDNIDSQLAGLYFKYQDGYYWASKDSGNTWEKIGAVGNAEPWMVLSNDGTKNITFSSESGVDISGTMANKSGTTVTATTGAQSGNYLALTVPSTGYYSTSSKVQYALSSLGTVPANYVLKDQTFTSSAGVKVSGTMANYGSGTEYISSSGTTKNIGSTSYLSLAVPATGYYTTSSRINYALSHFGSAAKSEVLNGKTFTSTAGISVSGSMANKSGTTVAASTLSSIAVSGVNYLGVTIPSAGYYDTTSKLRTSVKYNPSGTITKPSTAPSYTEYSTAGNYTNTTYDLTLASGTQLTLPAGYYDNSINVYSKVSSGSITGTLDVDALHGGGGDGYNPATSGSDTLVMHTNGSIQATSVTWGVGQDVREWYIENTSTGQRTTSLNSSITFQKGQTIFIYLVNSQKGGSKPGGWYGGTLTYTITFS